MHDSKYYIKFQHYLTCMERSVTRKCLCVFAVVSAIQAYDAAVCYYRCTIVHVAMPLTDMAFFPFALDSPATPRPLASL